MANVAAASARPYGEPSPWTRPQQLIATGYGLWTALWTLVVGVVLNTPAHLASTMRDQGYPGQFIRSYTSDTTHSAAVGGAVISAALGLVIAYFSYRGRRWSFWAGLIWFGFTGLGAIWVPLRPQAHIGEAGLTLIVHALINDLPGLPVAGWMLVGLIRYRHPWAYRYRYPRARTTAPPGSGDDGRIYAASRLPAVPVPVNSARVLLAVVAAAHAVIPVVMWLKQDSLRDQITHTHPELGVEQVDRSVTTTLASGIGFHSFLVLLCGYLAYALASGKPRTHRIAIISQALGIIFSVVSWSSSPMFHAVIPLLDAVQAAVIVLLLTRTARSFVSRQRYAEAAATTLTRH